MILLDTHVLVWWVSSSSRLSRASKSAIASAIKKDGIAISAISVWEICLLALSERLQLKSDVHVWLGKVLSLPILTVVSVDASIAERSMFLPGSLPKDPADRMIVATALEIQAPLVTIDQKIRHSNVVPTIW